MKRIEKSAEDYLISEEYLKGDHMKRTGNLSVNAGISRLDETRMARAGADKPLEAATNFLSLRDLDDGDFIEVEGTDGSLGNVPVIFITDARLAAIEVISVTSGKTAAGKKAASSGVKGSGSKGTKKSGAKKAASKKSAGAKKKKSTGKKSGKGSGK